MCIGEQRTTAEPVEESEEISLDESRPEQMTRMGTLASLLIRQDLAAFLMMNQDVFAWSHEDMPGIRSEEHTSDSSHITPSRMKLASSNFLTSSVIALSRSCTNTHFFCRIGEDARLTFSL